MSSATDVMASGVALAVTLSASSQRSQQRNKVAVVHEGLSAIGQLQSQVSAIFSVHHTTPSALAVRLIFAGCSTVGTTSTGPCRVAWAAYSGHIGRVL